MILPEDQWIEWNGQRVHWFIGDGFYGSPRPLNGEQIPNMWEAWGRCNGHPYQMFAYFNDKTRELTDIMVLNQPDNYYFHKETYELLTKPLTPCQ